jgi:hypothetical protein
VRQFLSALPVGDHEYEISIGTSADAVAHGGLVSPVFPAFGEPTDGLDGSSGLLLCFADSPSALLSVVQNALPRRHRSRTLMTYGLASVLVAGDIDELREIESNHRDLVAASELWPLSSGKLVATDIERQVRQVEQVVLNPIERDDLPYDAACQVRQLNVSLALAIHRASVFTPELTAALQAIAAAASDLVDALPAAGEDWTVDDVSMHHYYLSRLLEINAGLAMVISQTLGGVPPLLNSEYPVGEYSLLGIGTAARALWSFYHHLRRCFASANHAQRLRVNGESVVSFDPFVNSQSLDYTKWRNALARLPALPDAEQRVAAPHLLHFSSRFGFHETAYTLGASWQSLHASSSREWHLLTLTHEFIHSQVRHLTAAIYPRTLDWARLKELYRGAAPENALESMQAALVGAMARYAAAREASESVGSDEDVLESDGYIIDPTPQELGDILAYGLRYLQEIVVHVLDFLYTFHGDSSTYLSAIWQSWSTVPSVTERTHDYLLRSLCAIASDSVMPDQSTTEVFRSAVEVATKDLRRIAEEFGSPVVDQALAYLEDVEGSERLEIEFSQAYFVARFTREFLFDPDVATALSEDDLTALGDPGGPIYVFEPGEYPDSPIESPLAFLSDRFRRETKVAGENLEFASLWQLVMLVDPRAKDW